MKGEEKKAYVKPDVKKHDPADADIRTVIYYTVTYYIS